MNRISYEFFDSSCEISEAVLEGGDITFSFPEGTHGYFCLSNKKYRLTSNELTLPLSLIENGIYTPRLIIPEAELVLPPFEKRDRLITLPEKEGTARKLSLRLARISCRVRELDKKLTDLENYVRGTTCF